MSRLEWSERAKKDLRRLDRRKRERVVAAARRLAGTGEGDVRRLKGRAGELALRVGEYRVLFTLDPSSSIVTILRVRPRGQAYRR